MATYLQGQQDYVTQIQPTKPNLQFDAQMLGNLQNKYDAGHKKVSELYGSLLNSAMTRTDNIQARNEFFQMINQDIRRMGSLDFSLQQNVDAAANVFQSIYTNKGIVKDMVWTKNFQNQMSKRNGLKNNTDTEKTGAAWDIGDRAMAYQREAFANATAEEALGMRNAEYVPQFNMMKDAVKLAKAADLNVTIDKISGKYKITTRNGDLIKSPLTTLFAETFAKDPKYKSMYDTQAYVYREDWTHSRVKTGEAVDLDAAKLDYLKDFQTRQKNQLEKSASALSVDLDYLDQKVADERKAYDNKEFTADSDRGRQLQEYIKLQNGAKSAQDYTNSLIQANKSTNPDASYDVLARNIDNQRSYDYMNKDITAAVRTLAFRDAEQTLTADEFAKLDEKYQQDINKMALQHKYDKELQNIKDAAALERERLTAENASLTSQSTLNSKMALIRKTQEDIATKYSPSAKKVSVQNNNAWVKSGAVSQLPVTDAKLKEWKDNGDQGKIDIFNKLMAEEDAKETKAKVDAMTAFAYGNKAGTITTEFSEIPYVELYTKQALQVSATRNMQNNKSVAQNYTRHIADKYFAGDIVKANEEIKRIMADDAIQGTVSIESQISK